MPVEVEIRINKYGSGDYEDVAKLVIMNDGEGTRTMGNYVWALDVVGEPVMNGERVQYPRKDGAVQLVTLILEDAGYGIQDY